MPSLVILLSDSCMRCAESKSRQKYRRYIQPIFVYFPAVHRKCVSKKAILINGLFAENDPYLLYFTSFLRHLTYFYKYPSSHGFSDCIAGLNYL